MRVAINGMGRIGRLLFRRLVQDPAFDVVAVNDIMSSDNLAYLLRYDSVYGPAPFSIDLENQQFTIAEKKVAVFSEINPAALPWKNLDIDVVLECTGQFTKASGAAQHINAGAKKVMLSTTGSEDIPLMIFGFNQHQLDPTQDLLSPGGCMTNCATSVLHALRSLPIESVQIHVIHSYTSRQELVDAPHADFRRGRAAAASIIPVPVDLFESLERLFPHLKKQITTITSRVPVVNGAVADFSLSLSKPAAIEEVNSLLQTAAANDLQGVLAYTEDPLVSLDVKGNRHSAIVDGSLTAVAGRQVKVFALFDNEYGYTSRMIDWLNFYTNKLGLFKA